MFNFFSLASATSQIWLYSIIFISFVYLIYRYKKSELIIYLILIFYPALFAFLGKNITDIWRVSTLLLTLRLCYKYNVFRIWKLEDISLTILFIFFSFSILISSFINRDTLTIILSQYSRYIIAYCLWFIIRNEFTKSSENIIKLERFFFEIFIVQIFVSIVKLILFKGTQIESLVGTISHIGGAAGTTIPILGFIFLWFYRKGNFQIKDWMFIIGLLLIGYLAGKRAVWFILPVIISIFMFFVSRIKINKTIIFAVLLSPVAFYLGARITPTLNPENKVWGSFDLDYIFNYADEYSFGKAKKNLKIQNFHSNENLAEGRGGATVALVNRFFGSGKLSDNDWFGVGFKTMYATDYGQFSKSNLSIELNHKGSATGVFQTYVTTGYLGIITTVPFFFLILFQIKLKRLRWVIIAIVSWEYFFYTGLIFRTTAFMALLIYFIHYSNSLERKKRININNKKVGRIMYYDVNLDNNKKNVNT